MFIIGDNALHGNSKNCPLKFGETYEILVVITERNISSESIILTRRTSIYFGEISKNLHEAWLIPLTLLLIVTSAALYYYRRYYLYIYILFYKN